MAKRDSGLHAWHLWRRLGLREYLAVILMAVALLPLLALYWAEQRQIRSDALSSMGSRVELIADVQQRRIDLELRRLRDMVDLVASRTQMRLSLDAYQRDGDPSHLELIERILNDALKSSASLRGIWIRDRSGRTLTQVTRDATPINSLDGAAIPSRGLVPILVHGLDTQAPEIWLSGQLSLNDAAIGTIHLLVGMDDILSLLADFSHQSPGGETLLLMEDDRRRLFVLSAREGIRHLTTAPHGPLVDLLWARHRPDEEPRPADSEPLPPEQVLVHATRSLQLDGASLLVHTNMGDIARGTRAHLDLLLYITVSLVLLALLAAVLLARAISGPIRLLTEATRRLREGDYQVRIEEHGWGELAMLTRAFNETVASLQNEIRARQRFEQELAIQANTDPLTGLNNRRRFMELLRHCLELTRHPSGGALIYLDLDGFKPINDQYGHEAGDATLCIVAERLRRVVREKDAVGRLGGDEFAILLSEMEPGFEPEAVAKRVIETLNQPMLVQGLQLRVGCSLGVAYITPRTDPARLLKEADAAMYRAKSSKSHLTHIDS